ncbi:MAG: DUF2115 family protein [Methanobacterium sp.]|jgi:uncharacterized protein (UPF0305 family)
MLGLESLDFSKKIEKNELLIILKKEASDIPIIEIMKACNFLREDRKYLCPVKENQKNNPRAVCGFCIAEQDEDML